MQTNLFSNAFPQQEQGIEKLKNFEFDAAIVLLNQAHDLSEALPNNQVYREAAQFCLASQIDASTAPEQIVSLWEMLHQEQTFAGKATSLQKILMELFAHRMLDLHPFDADGVFQHGDLHYHISACYIHASQFKAAHQSLMHLLSDLNAPLPARYWGYFGDAALATQHKREANLGYLRLLASNPLDVDWATFRHRELKNLFQELLEKDDLQSAYGSWPFAAWLEELIYVPQGNQYIEKMAAENMQKVDGSLALTPYEQQLRFAVLVFCDQSDRNSDNSVQRRKMMKDLDGEKFQQYLEECEHR